MDSGEQADDLHLFVPQRTKPDLSGMPSHAFGDHPDSLFVPHDDHYHNEQPTRRPRLNLPLPRLSHFPGDGLDFRRPASSRPANEALPRISTPQVPPPPQDRADVIDLTERDGDEEETQASAGSSARATRLPRFGREVIDLEATEDGDVDENTFNLPGANYLALPPRRHGRVQYSSLRRPARLPSPSVHMDELEIVGVRPSSQSHTHSRQATPGQRIPPPRSTSASIPPQISANFTAVDLTGDDEDVQVVGSRPILTGTNIDPPRTATGHGNARAADNAYGIGEIVGRMRGEGVNLGERLMGRLHRWMDLDEETRRRRQLMADYQRAQPFVHGTQQSRRHDPNQARDEQRRQLRNLMGIMDPWAGTAVTGGAAQAPGILNIDMNYEMPAFDIGLGGGQREPTPTYSPPSSPGKGFTRNPTEDEVVVCPNCGDELAMGDSEEKQQIWVVKSCGHVYCGRCACHRLVSRNPGKKGKGRATEDDLPSPFKYCVVEGCHASAGKTSMVHVYLGS